MHTVDSLVAQTAPASTQGKAIVRSQAQRAVRRMWDDIHTLHYNIFDEVEDGAAAAGGSQQAASAVGAAPQAPAAAVKLVRNSMPSRLAMLSHAR